jgi:hypothetical protein
MARKSYRTDSGKPEQKPSFRFDTFKLDKVEVLPSGGIKIPARISRTGIQVYHDENGKAIREYRPPEEVFSKATLDSFKGATVTDLHPSEAVTPDNFKKHVRGHLGDDIKQDGEYTAGTVYVNDAELIAAIQSADRKELSAGYDTIVEPTPGVTPNGERYDRIQRRIRGNHVAIGPANWGRAGTEVALRLDSKGNAYLGSEESKGEDSMKFTIKIDGVEHTFEAPDESFKQILEKKFKADSEENAALTSDKTELQKKLDTVSGENDTLKKQLEEASDPTKLDARVKERVSLEENAKLINPKIDCAELSDKEIMVIALGDDFKADASDDFIRGAFQAAVKAAGSTKKTGREDSLDKARRDSVDVKKGEPESILEKKLTAYHQRRKDACKAPLALTNQE